MMCFFKYYMVDNEVVVGVCLYVLDKSIIFVLYQMNYNLKLSME